MKRRFEWDERKASVNQHKHGVSFAEAALVFKDPFAILIQDRIEHGEQRWHTIGMARNDLLLLVAHTLHFENEHVEVIRIISARRLNKHERQRYENGQHLGR